METTYLPDRQKEEAFNSLEFSDNNGEEAVRCQCCNNWIHIVGRLQSPRGNRADTLRKRISYLQERYRKEHLHER
jgi:hypothetical protein